MNIGSKSTRILIVTGGVVGTVAATAALEAFLDDANRDPSWAVAIAAVSTIVLVIVTCVYVAFTGQLVALQQAANEQGMRSESERLVRRVMETLFPIQRHVLTMRSDYPLDATAPPSENADAGPAMKLDQAKDTLRAVATQLPDGLVLPTLQTATALAEAAIACQMLNVGVQKEINRAMAEKRVFEWDRVRSWFYEEDESRKVFKSGDDQGLLEWSDLSEGKYLTKAVDQIGELETKFRDWLRENTQTKR